MFLDMGYCTDNELDSMCEHFLPWLEPRLRSGEYRAWFIVAADDSIVAGLGLWLMAWPPHMVPGLTRANILNVYTHPGHRRRGLARRLMLTALDWCAANGIRTVILHASHEGRPLYESLDFRPTNEMRVTLPRLVQCP
jgi:GNAT superfamily N-acetyltransferase